jgi:hypothetical protein
MLGAMITFLAVCAMVAIYMFIVHSFLRAAEEPEDRLREEQALPTSRQRGTAGRSQPRWAH